MAIDLNTKPWYVAAIVGVVLGAAMFTVMHLYVFKDIKVEIGRLEEKIDDLEREIEKGRAAKADLPRLEEDIRNYEIELGRLKKILPTRRETDNLIKRAKQLTERGGFRLTNFTPGTFEDRGFYLEWPIRRGARRHVPRAGALLRPPEQNVADHQRQRPHDQAFEEAGRKIHDPR